MARVTNTTKTRSGYVIVIAFPLQQWLHERTSMLRYTYISCIVKLPKDMQASDVLTNWPVCMIRGRKLVTLVLSQPDVI